MALEQEFEHLGRSLEALIALLEEAGEPFWIPYLQRGLDNVRGRRLAGATAVLGCYGGEDTLSDLVIGRRWEESDALKFRNLNARLAHLRTQTFEAADAITSRRSW